MYHFVIVFYDRAWNYVKRSRNYRDFDTLFLRRLNNNFTIIDYENIDVFTRELDKFGIFK